MRTLEEIREARMEKKGKDYVGREWKNWQGKIQAVPEGAEGGMLAIGDCSFDRPVPSGASDGLAGAACPCPLSACRSSVCVCVCVRV